MSTNPGTLPVSFPTGKGTSVVIPVVNSTYGQALAHSISLNLASQLNVNAITPYFYDGTQSFNPPVGNTVLILSGSGVALTLTTPNFSNILVTAPGHVTVYEQSTVGNQNFVAGSGGVNYIASPGNGNILIAGGDNNVTIRQDTTGTHNIIVGGTGNNDLELLGGNNTVLGSWGNNVYDLGTGNNVIVSNGFDAFYTNGKTAVGNNTIQAAGNTNALYVEGGYNKVTFINGSGASTLYGQNGSDTVNGGVGGGYFQGGSAGNNLLQAGSGQATLVGGGNNDILTLTAGNASDQLIAGSGNETLAGSLSTGANTFVAGSGADYILGGLGNDTIQGSTGTATIFGGAGANQFLFVDGSAGGTVTIGDFGYSANNKVALQGYGASEVQNALSGAVINGNSETITLSDNTSITFAGVTNLNSSNFVTV